MAYIYSHTRLDTNNIFYIGLGTGGSIDNYKRAHQKTKRSILWNRIVSKSEYRVDIIEDNLERKFAEEREKFWIEHYGRINDKTGTLVNITKGGDTISNHPDKEDILKKISRASSGKNNPNYGSKFLTPEYIQKQIISNSPYGYKILDIQTGEEMIFYSEKNAATQLGIPRSTFNYQKRANKNIKQRYKILEIFENTSFSSTKELCKSASRSIVVS